MVLSATTPLCVGITTAAVTSFTTVNVAGHSMVAIPGGHAVIGSTAVRSAYGNANPHWVLLSPYVIGKTETSESQYRKIMGPLEKEDPASARSRLSEKLSEKLKHVSGNQPVTWVNYYEATNFIKRLWNEKKVVFQKAKIGKTRLPREAEHENAGRGPAENIPQLMELETGRFTPSDVVDFVEGRFENFVFEVIGEIFTDPKAEPFQRLVRKGIPFFGWRVYATPSGRFDTEEAWLVDFDAIENDPIAPVEWDPMNAYGLHNMAGNVYEWVFDKCRRYGSTDEGYAENPKGLTNGNFRILRGGGRKGFFGTSPELEAVAARFIVVPSYWNFSVGFRIAASQNSGFKKKHM